MKTCAPELIIFLVSIMTILLVPGSANSHVSIKESDALEVSCLSLYFSSLYFKKSRLLNFKPISCKISL